MALINCPECGKEVSDKARSCIHCGYPLDDFNSSEKAENNILMLNSNNADVNGYLWIYQGFPYNYVMKLQYESLPIVIDMGDDLALKEKMSAAIEKLGGFITRVNIEDISKEKIDEYNSLRITNKMIQKIDVMRYRDNLMLSRYEKYKSKIEKIVGLTEEEEESRKNEKQLYLERSRREREEEFNRKYGVSRNNSGSDYLINQSPKKKDASVIGRAVAGSIIAGPTGAVVGALSAIDKNNKNR